MNDIELYTSGTDTYNQLQHSRPDYVNAVKQIVQFAQKYLESDSVTTLVDFCCGTGSITKEIAEKIDGLYRAVLIDINEQFLEIVKNSRIKAEQLESKQGDILSVPLSKEADVVLSVFAYHHMPDKDKDTYIKQIKKTLKSKGLVLWAEIYSPNKETTISYYENLFLFVPENQRTPQLKKFLEETAHSESFEFKVEKSFADTQLKENGLTLLKSVKIWPKDDSSVGTFVEVWKN